MGERFLQLVSRLGFCGALCYLAGRLARGVTLPSARLSWSQFGEDLVARDILGLEPGFYVDVGCNDPIRWSNTYLFYLHGWSGLLLDGNQQLVDQCRRRRPVDTSDCCLLGEAEGEGEIAIYDDHAISSAVVAHNAERRSQAQLIEKRRVPIRSLTSVLSEHGAPARIDFLSIDVEGMDLMVLKGLDFDIYKPRLIAIEDAAFDPLRPLESDIVKFLRDRGYRLYSHVYPTLFFLARGVESKGFHSPIPAAGAPSDC
jgi:FkbM family methyltransferase